MKLILGLLCLVKGADFLVEGSSRLAKKCHISSRVIGLTIVALGTSLPELLVSLTASNTSHVDIALSNVLGSNLCNLLLVLGTSLLLKEIPKKRSNLIQDIPLNIGITMLVGILCNTKKEISSIEGFLLVSMFLGYTAFLLKKNTQEEEDITTGENTLLSIGRIILGSIGLKIGGDLTIQESIQLAQTIGVSEKLIGLTVIAIGTSLPELITSLVATKRGDTQLALGNILGSNIINLTLVLGSSAMLHSMAYNIEYNYDFLFALISTLLVGTMLFLKRKLTIRNGILLLLLYTGYILSFL